MVGLILTLTLYVACAPERETKDKVKRCTSSTNRKKETKAEWIVEKKWETGVCKQTHLE